MQKISDIVLEKTSNSDPELKKRLLKISEDVISDFRGGLTRQLLYGKVQSGKTTTFINIIAKALNEDYKIIVVLTGTTLILDDQAKSRIEAAFGTGTIFEDETGNSCQLLIDNATSLSEIMDSIDEDHKYIFVSKKAASIEDIERLSLTKHKVLIVDDEADFATPNTSSLSRKKEGERTFTNKHLDRVTKNKLVHYLAVTATPQSNVLTFDDEFNSPEKIHYIQPGTGYLGVSEFYDDNVNYIVPIPDDDESFIKNHEFENAKSLVDAIYAFVIIASLVKNKQIKKKNFDSDKLKFEFLSMMINFDLNKNPQTELKIFIGEFINRKFRNIKTIEKILDTRNAKHMLELLEVDYDDESVMKSIISSVESTVKNKIEIIELNSTPNAKEELNSKQTKLKQSHVIYIGGHNLSRGYTVKNLVVSYFFIKPKRVLADTTLQRARWFGYRNDWATILQVYMPMKVRDDFKIIKSVEDEIWHLVGEGQSPDVKKLREIYSNYVSISPTSVSKTGGTFRVKTGMNRIWHNYSAVRNNQDHEEIKVFIQKLRQTLTWNREEWFLSATISLTSIVKHLKEFLDSIKPSWSSNTSLSGLYYELNCIIQQNEHEKLPVTELKLIDFRLKNGEIRGSLKDGYDLKEKYTPFGRGNTGSRLNDEDYSKTSTERIHNLQISEIITSTGETKVFLALFQFSDKNSLTLKK